MRTPSFVSTSRAPSAFGVAPKHFAVRPSGQSSGGTASLATCGTDANGARYGADSTGNEFLLAGTGAVGCDENGAMVDGNGALVTASPGAATPNMSQSQPSIGVTPAVNPVVPTNTSNNVNNQGFNNPYGAINQGIGGIAGAIGGVLSSTQQPAIAQTTANANVAIAGLNANAANSRAQIQSSAAIQQAQIMAALQSNTMLYVVGGVVVLGIIGAVVYFRQSPSPAAPARAARQNPFSALANPMKHMKNSMEPHMKSVRAVHGALRSTRKRA